MAKKSKPIVATPRAALGVISVFTAPLSCLFISPDNVRVAEVSESGIVELAAMIEAQKLLHPLQVTVEQIDGVPTGRFAVEAGGRRLRTLNLLAQAGKIASDEPISLVLHDDGDATEVSLIENLSSEAMHPADEFSAFQTLCNQGQSIETIAGKFGISVLHVQRRLKLANVAPSLLALYRQNEMTLDQVTAFAGIDDQERQVQVWEGLPEYHRHPSHIKRKLMESEVLPTDRRVCVVGLQNYVAAGGAMRQDLFSEDDDTYLTNIALLDTLFTQVLENAAENAKAEGWAWVDVVPSLDYTERQKYCALPKLYRQETEQEQGQREQLETEFLELSEKIEALEDDGEWAETRRFESSQEVVERKIEALKESLRDFDGVDKTDAGAIVTVQNDSVLIQRGMKRQTVQTQPNTKAEKKAQMTDAEKSALMPESLMANLTSQRTFAIQAALLDNAHIALAALAHKMAITAFGTFSPSPIKVNLVQSRHTLEKNSPTLAESRAAIRIDAESAAWREKLPKAHGEWLQWFLAQDQSEAISMIVFCTASCVEAVQRRPDERDDGDQIARELNLDMADWWTPSTDAYLNLVPKQKLIDMVTEIKSAEVAAPMAKMKRGEVVAFAAEHGKDSRWLPTVLRRAACQ